MVFPTTRPLLFESRKWLSKYVVNFLQMSHFRSNSLANEKIKIIEVSPRDGLQNVKQFVPTDLKMNLISRLVDCGVDNVEVTSFVSPKWIPQLKDSKDLCTRVGNYTLTREKLPSGCEFIVLTPNEFGFRSALEVHSKFSGRLPIAVAIFISASEGFSLANINCSIADSLDRVGRVMQLANVNKIRVRGYISCVIACPKDGPTNPSIVADLSEKLIQLGCYEISLGDTIGVGNPDSVRKLLEIVMKRVDASKLALHLHDTNGRALENIEVGIQMGIRAVDASVAGIGGCPYAGPAARGNVDTCKVVEKLHSLGFRTDINIDKLNSCSEWIRGELKILAQAAGV